MLRSDYAFSELSFVVKSLDEPPPTELGRLTAKLQQKRVTVLTGAGSSAALPSDLPGGARVAELLREWAIGVGLSDEMARLGNPNNLGEVAQAVEDRFDRQTLVTQLLKLVDWEKASFNLAHLAIALLYAEDFLNWGFTANWDLLVKRAAATVAGLHISFPCDKPTLNTASFPLFVHVHGDADHPDSLVATNEHLTAPDAIKWTQPQLEAAFVTQELALIGFAAEPAYVLETIERAVAASGTDPVAVVSKSSRADFVTGSPELARVTKVDTRPELYIEGSATERLGDVLRVCYAARLRTLLEEAERRANEVAAPPLPLTQTGMNRVREVLLKGTTADLLGLMWRAAQLSAAVTVEVSQPTLKGSGDPFAYALAALFLLCSCSDVALLEGRREGLRVTLDTGVSADMWIVMPEEAVRTSSAVQLADANSGRFAYPGDEALPLVFLCARTMGIAPPTTALHLAGPSAPGMVVSPVRHPTDALTLDDLDARKSTINGAAANFADLVKLTP